jgi:hypothetical protein
MPLALDRPRTNATTKVAATERHGHGDARDIQSYIHTLPHEA